MFLQRKTANYRANTMNEEFRGQESHSVAAAATILGVSDKTVYRLIYNQKIKVLTGFDRLRIPRNELDKLLGAVAVYLPKQRNQRARNQAGNVEI